MIKPLEYYFIVKGIIEHVIFNKYTIDEFGVVRNKKSGNVLSYSKRGKYNALTIHDDDGKLRGILIGRAIASTFLGPPPTLEHTADHIDNKRPDYDVLTNIRWLDKYGQSKNRDMPENLQSAFIIVKDGEEKSAQEWVYYFKDNKSPRGKKFNERMFEDYARRNKYGFSYKIYPDLIGEVWKEIIGSKSTKGQWNISNMNRVKYITKHAENVLDGERLRLTNGYPRIHINGKRSECHILSFKTFYPEEYANKKPGEMVLHEDDDKMDFRPHKLRLGTRSENGKDAHDNGKYDDAKTARIKCASYINGDLEKEYVSQRDAAKYLKKLGYDKASFRGIGMALSGDRKTAYGRTWKKS